MREALARIDNDFVLSEPRRKATKRTGLSSFLEKPKQIAAFAAKYANFSIGILFIALMAAVLLNALVWQKGRHPAPLFGHSLSIESKPEARSVETRTEVPPPPPVRPIPLAAPEPAAEQAPTPPHGRDPMAEAAELQTQKSTPPRDPIAQLLKSATPPETSKSLLAAQRALMKLGYVVKPDGIMRPATRQALEQFEREHNLPPHGTLSPKVMHELSAEAGIAVE